MGAALIYSIARRADWLVAQQRGGYAGSDDDRRDGFIHFSTAAQVRESCRRHRAGQCDLVLLAVDPDALGDALRWEPSRGGTLFPHLYAELSVAAVVAVHDLPLGPDGEHVFPPLGADGEPD